MKINWTVRLKNKVWLATMISFLISTVYQWLGYFDIAPVVTQDAVLQLASAVLQVLSLLGLIVDPTTAGVADSERALGYETPYSQEESTSADAQEWEEKNL